MDTPQPQPPPEAQPAEQPKCGIVMPISLTDGCGPDHWTDVREILDTAIRAAGFVPNLVSNADEVGIIQRRIIENLYKNPIVVCDVSGKNANVMFELGLRLAFDKPTVIVKDDETEFSFDTSPIEHVAYPRDLRHPKIEGFKAQLISKLKATDAAAKSDAAYSPFLKAFGPFISAKIDTREVPRDEFILKELQRIGGQVDLLYSEAHSKRLREITAGLFSGARKGWQNPYSVGEISGQHTRRRAPGLWVDNTSAEEVRRLADLFTAHGHPPLHIEALNESSFHLAFDAWKDGEELVRISREITQHAVWEPARPV